MNSDTPTVYVLGAGFTRAFIPQAPLLRGYDLTALVDSCDEQNFPHAHRILRFELNRAGNPGNRLDLERLMTRLDGYMPYDFERKAVQELDLLFHKVKLNLVDRLQETTGDIPLPKDLPDFAAHCIRNRIACVTFNYDDVLDRALWAVEGVYNEPCHRPYWHPNSGYGFFCRPSHACVSDVGLRMGESSMLLLKLHGSINWHIRLGAPQPYDTHSIVHHETWHPPFSAANPQVPSELIERHLKKDRFIVLPVLMKSVLTQEPVLRLVWSLAYEKLMRAEQIVFVGYSLPRTDVAANFLFGEALQGLAASQIKVVNFAQDDQSRNEVRSAYREVFPKLNDERFDFRDALQWCQEVVGGSN